MLEIKTFINIFLLSPTGKLPFGTAKFNLSMTVLHIMHQEHFINTALKIHLCLSSTG
jgi:hypothetical protein